MIETIVVGEAKEYAEITLPHLSKFALALNADFRVRSNFLPQMGTPPMNPDSPQWEKLNVITDFASQDRYDLLLYVDADVLPNPRCIGQVNKLVSEFRKGTMAAVLEMPETDFEKWAAFYLNWFQEFNETNETPQPYFNSGVMFISRDYAREWASQMPSKFNEWFWEQHYLNATAPRGVQQLDARFNWCLQRQPPNDVVFGHAYNTDKIAALTKLSETWSAG